MADNFLPNPDADLLAWSANFSKGINAAGGELGISVQQAAEYADLHASFAAAMKAAGEPTTRTRASVSGKNDARRLLRDRARLLARIVRAQPDVSAQQRIELGLAARIGGGASAAIHAPEERPHVVIMYTIGRRVKVKLRRGSGPDGHEPEGRGRPERAAGAVVFSFVGDVATDDLSQWRFERCTSRTSFDVEFAAGVAPGSKVHLAACWYNPRGDRGPMSLPASTYIGEGVSAKAA